MSSEQLVDLPLCCHQLNNRVHIVFCLVVVVVVLFVSSSCFSTIPFSTKFILRQLAAPQLVSLPSEQPGCHKYISVEDTGAKIQTILEVMLCIVVWVQCIIYGFFHPPTPPLMSLAF